MYNIKKISDSLPAGQAGKLEIEVKLETQEFEPFLNLAIKNIKNDVELPGFRKGAVPEKIILEKIGDAKILEEAVELAVRDSWLKIIKEEKLEPIGRPEISITKIARGNPLEFKISAIILGDIKLPDYKKIAREIIEDTEKSKGELSATEEEVSKALEYVKKNNSSYNGSNEEELKKLIAENIVYEKQMKAQSDQRVKIIEKINSSSKMEIPRILIENEKEKMLGEYKSSLGDMGLKWEDYLAHIKKTEDDLRKDWEDQSLKRARFGLILREIAKKESLSPSMAKLEEETDKILRSLKEEERRNASPEAIRDYLFGRLQNEMVFDFLEKN